MTVIRTNDRWRTGEVDVRPSEEDLASGASQTVPSGSNLVVPIWDTCGNVIAFTVEPPLDNEPWRAATRSTR